MENFSRSAVHGLMVRGVVRPDRYVDVSVHCGVSAVTSINKISFNFLYMRSTMSLLCAFFGVAWIHLTPDACLSSLVSLR